MIKVKVPDSAGTGLFKVNGVSSPMPLTVNYTHVPVYSSYSGFTEPTRQRKYLRNLDGLGGYTFTLNTDFAANTLAVEAFRRALNEWSCNTDMN